MRDQNQNWFAVEFCQFYHVHNRFEVGSVQFKPVGYRLCHSFICTTSSRSIPAGRLAVLSDLPVT